MKQSSIFRWFAKQSQPTPMPALSQKTKWRLGLIAFGPYIFIGLILMSLVLSLIANLVISEKVVDAVLGYVLLVLLPLGWLATVAVWIPWYFCMRHLKSQSIKGMRAVVWHFFLGGLWPFATAYYWYKFIWREEQLV